MRRVVIALVLGLGLLLTACRDAAPPAVPVAPQKMTVAFTEQPQCTLMHIAIAKGYFREQGIDLQPQIHTYGKAALQAVLDHKADIATVAETPLMFNILKGEKLGVLANIVVSNRNNALLARANAGVAVVADLKGKRIGYTPGTTSDFFLSSLLTANGIARRDIVQVSLKPEDMQRAITGGEVDAVSTWNYPLSQIRHALGSGAVVLYDREIYTETFNLAAQQDFIARNPLTLQRFLRALIRAEEFARAQPAQAQAIMAAATRVEPAMVREIWGDFQFRVGLDQILLITLEDETRWAMSNHLTDQTRMPDYLSHIYFDGLNAVRPSAVHIKR